MRRLLMLFLAFLLSVPALAELRDDFPRPAELETDIAFWKRIYTEVDSGGGLLHDNRHLGVVYRVIRFPEDAGPRRRSALVDEAREQVRDGLLRLAGDGEADDPVSRELRRLWGDQADAAALRAAADRIRFQLGQRDRFLAGLERSGLWDEWIRRHMREEGVPEGMVALPHVESSFTPYARSRVGAAGMWQFTRGTGRRFMQVDHVVDERLDPWRASEAAAQLLRHNYEVTGSWPLALVAYNHGAAGVRRAVSVMGSDDIVPLFREYEGRRFGFASRNFYPAFLAALDVHAEPDRYFEDYQLAEARVPEELILPAYVPARQLADALSVSLESLRRHNPALLSPIWDGDKHVPRGYALRLPPGTQAPSASQLLASLPDDARYARQAPDRYHVLRQGETLSHVARRYGTTVTTLTRLNGLRSAHRVRAGQRLTLPTSGGLRVETMPSDGRYQVRRGDNLSEIAARFQLTVESLAELNELDNGDRIYPGQELRLRPEAATERVAEAPDEATVSDTASETEDMGASVEMATVTVRETLSEAAGSPPEAQPELAADPSDYAVSPDGHITLQWGETLGHHADWLAIPTQRLRTLNGLSYGLPVTAGQRLKLDFSRVQPAEFERRRNEFHEQRQRAYFQDWQIVGSENYTVSSGDSIWRLTRETRLPRWLIQQYNPDLDMDRLRPGQVLRLPEVAPRE